MADDVQLISAAELASGLAGKFRGVLGISYVTPDGAEYRWNGSIFSGSGGGGASLTNITAAALAALTSGTASATTLYRVTDGAYRDTVYLYDTTSDTLHPLGIPPSAFGFA